MRIFLSIFLMMSSFTVPSFADDPGVFTYSEDGAKGGGNGGVFMVGADPITPERKDDAVPEGGAMPGRAEAVAESPAKGQTGSRNLGVYYTSEDVKVSNISREKPDFEVSGISTTAGYLRSDGSDFPPVGKYYRSEDVTVGKKRQKTPLTASYTTAFPDSQPGEEQSGEKQISDERKRKKDPTVKVESGMVDSNIKDPNKYQVKPQIYSEKDEKTKLVFDNVAYVNPDSKDTPVTKVVRSQYERGYKPDVVKSLGAQGLGQPYSASNYITEDAAKDDGNERTLGVPYSIRSRKQKEAIDRGY
jgi:hypothetical protein